MNFCLVTLSAMCRHFASHLKQLRIFVPMILSGGLMVSLFAESDSIRIFFWCACDWQAIFPFNIILLFPFLFYFCWFFFFFFHSKFRLLMIRGYSTRHNVCLNVKCLVSPILYLCLKQCALRWFNLDICLFAFSLNYICSVCNVHSAVIALIKN